MQQGKPSERTTELYLTLTKSTAGGEAEGAGDPEM